MARFWAKFDNFEHISSRKKPNFSSLAPLALARWLYLFWWGSARKKHVREPVRLTVPWKCHQAKAFKSFRTLWWRQVRTFRSKFGRPRCTTIIKTSLDPFKRNVRKVISTIVVLEIRVQCGRNWKSQRKHEISERIPRIQENSCSRWEIREIDGGELIKLKSCTQIADFADFWFPWRFENCILTTSEFITDLKCSLLITMEWNFRFP